MQSAWLKYWYFQGYVTQFRFGQCGSDAVGELTCSTGHMITNIGSADMIDLTNKGGTADMFATLYYLGERHETTTLRFCAVA